MKTRVIIYWLSCLALVAGSFLLVYSLILKENSLWVLAALACAFFEFVLFDILHYSLCLIKTSEYRILAESKYCNTTVKETIYSIQHGYDNLLKKDKYWHTIVNTTDEVQAQQILTNIKNGADPSCHIKTEVISN